MSGEMNLGFLWVITPILFPLFSAILRAIGKSSSSVISISGCITSVVALPPYLSAFNYAGTDGQAGLIFAVMPIYQGVGLILFSIVGYYITRRGSRDGIQPPLH